MRYHDMTKVARINSSGLSFLQAVFVIAGQSKPQQQPPGRLGVQRSYCGDLVRLLFTVLVEPAIAHRSQNIPQALMNLILNYELHDTSSLRRR